MAGSSDQSDREFFEMYPMRKDYVRAPLAGEFEDILIPPDAQVHVFWINQRTLVKALELPRGERLATKLEVFVPPPVERAA